MKSCVRFGRMLCPTAAGACAVLLWAGTVEGRPVIQPYGGSGYRYSVVAQGDGAGFEAPGFDDSVFADGVAAFGSGGGCPLQSTVMTAWAVGTDLLVRYTFTLGPCATGLTVGIAIDNDVQVFLNGIDISGGLIPHEFCPALDDIVLTPSDSLLVQGANVLAFRARDRGSESFFDSRVEIAVNNCPPECPEAPTVVTLWPPNHEMVAIDLGAVSGVTDADGDTLAFDVTSITQDEPLNDVGDGNTPCDAEGVGTGSPSVRAERAGPRDGRVYVISYDVSDGNGGSCSGAVVVQVPHDQRPGGDAVDSGQDFVSTDCPAALADTDGTRSVGFGDLLLVLADYGASKSANGIYWPDGDADLSGVVDFADIIAVLSAWSRH